MLATRFACCALVVFAVAAPGSAEAGCATQIGKLMSRQVENLNTRYHRVSEQLERDGTSPKLAAEGCRIARALEPRLREQLAALKKSGCSRDPDMGMAVADLVRGHEADLAAVRKTAASVCK